MCKLFIIRLLWNTVCHSSGSLIRWSKWRRGFYGKLFDCSLKLWGVANTSLIEIQVGAQVFLGSDKWSRCTLPDGQEVFFMSKRSKKSKILIFHSLTVDSFSNTKFQIQRRLSRRWSSLSKKLQCWSGHPTGLIRRLKALWGLKHWRANAIGGGDTAQSGYNLRIGDIEPMLLEVEWGQCEAGHTLGTLWTLLSGLCWHTLCCTTRRVDYPNSHIVAT